VDGKASEKVAAAVVVVHAITTLNVEALRSAITVEDPIYNDIAELIHSL
jgi:hypothetical protein